MSAISKAALDAAAAEFALSWPTDERMLQPPWPLDYRNEGLRRFVGAIITSALPYLIAESDSWRRTAEKAQSEMNEARRKCEAARALLRDIRDLQALAASFPKLHARVEAELGPNP